MMKRDFRSREANSKRQRRHHHYRMEAIKVYERWTGMPISELVKVLKLNDLEQQKASGVPPEAVALPPTSEARR